VNDLHYAIVIGINRYPGIGDLSGARADAEQFAAWLVDPNGGALPPANVKHVCVTDAEEQAFAQARGAKPTHDEIDYALQDIRDALKPRLDADEQAWDQTRLYFYVAGHGFAPQGGEGALFLANAESDALQRNIELNQYRRWCTTCAYFREVVVFADCCRTRVRSAAPGAGPGLEECPAPWKGRSTTWVIGFGSILGNPTYESPAAGADDQARGYFTKALLAGLSGSAPRDESGRITASKLSGFVRTVVADQTKGQQYPQQAQIYGPLADDITFGTTLAPSKHKVTIVLPANVAAAKVVKDGRLIEQWDGANRRWIVNLDDGLYEVDADGAALANGGLFKVSGDRDVDL
jgi:uncharacterized caspase-like protein